ncbi:MAG: hypothetical protein ACJAXM_000403 [Arenicella sp.]|jgi:hypothetical protein
MTVITIWLITVIFELFISSKSTEVLFDSSDSLYRGSIQPEFDHEFSRLISGALDKSLAQTVVHIFSEDDCLCQLTASRHIHEVKGKALAKQT